MVISKLNKYKEKIVPWIIYGCSTLLLIVFVLRIIPFYEGLLNSMLIIFESIQTEGKMSKEMMMIFAISVTYIFIQIVNSVVIFSYKLADILIRNLEVSKDVNNNNRRRR